MTMTVNYLHLIVLNIKIKFPDFICGIVFEATNNLSGI